MSHLGRFVIGAVVASVVAAGWLLGAGSGPAIAQDQHNTTDRRAKMLERFPEADADGDGTLTREETRAFFQARRGQGRGEQGHRCQHRC